MVLHTPPSPPATLLGGNLSQMRQDFLGFLMDTARICGDIAHFRAGPAHMYLLNHPDLIADVLVKRADLFYKTRSTKRLLGKFLGNGLISLEGMFHKQHRRLMQPAFHSKRIETYTRTMLEHTQQRLQTWQDRTVLDIPQEMTALTLGIVADTLFSVNVADQTQVAKTAMTTFADSLNLRLRSPIPLPDWIPTKQNRNQRAAVQSMDDLLFSTIRERRASGEDKGDLLSMLLESVDEDGVTRLTDQEVRDELLTMFFAGHETSASILSWICFLLTENPEVQDDLRAEIDAVLGSNPPTMQTIRQLVYLNQVVKEALRLYPPAWLFDREPVQDVEIGGYRIPKGRTIFISPYVTHRDSRFYEQPDQFLPQRFDADFEDQLPRYAYFPFGGGARVCIGQAFALAEVSMILTMILAQFRLELVPGQQIMPEPSATLDFKHGLQVRIIQI